MKKKERKKKKLMICLNFLSLWIYYISFQSIHPQKIKKKKIPNINSQPL